MMQSLSSNASDLYLRLYPDPSLRSKCIDCPKDYNERDRIGSEMSRIMFTHNGFGLSAPQVGLNWNMFVMRHPDYPNTTITVCNPKIIKYGTIKEKLFEGCLSFLGRRAPIERFKLLEVQYEHGDVTVTKQYEDIYARCIQHEMDHLNGVLIVDHINSNLSRKLFLEKYTKEKIKYARLG